MPEYVSTVPLVVSHIRRGCPSISTSVLPAGLLDYFFFFKGPGPPRHLPSSPTRLSSDPARTRAIPSSSSACWKKPAASTPAFPRCSRWPTRPCTTASPRLSGALPRPCTCRARANWTTADRKSTRLNSSHLVISYAVFCLKKKKRTHHNHTLNK